MRGELLSSFFFEPLARRPLSSLRVGRGGGLGNGFRRSARSSRRPSGPLACRLPASACPFSYPPAQLGRNQWSDSKSNLPDLVRTAATQIPRDGPPDARGVALRAVRAAGRIEWPAVTVRFGSELGETVFELLLPLCFFFELVRIPLFQQRETRILSFFRFADKKITHHCHGDRSPASRRRK